MSVNVAVLLLLGGDVTVAGDERENPAGRDGYRWLVLYLSQQREERCLRLMKQNCHDFIGGFGINLLQQQVLLASKGVFLQDA